MNGNELVTSLKNVRKNADRSEALTSGILSRVKAPQPLSRYLLQEAVNRVTWTIGVLSLLWLLCQGGALILLNIDSIWPSPILVAFDSPGLEIRAFSFLALALRSCIPLAVHGLVICLLISILSIPHPTTTLTWEGREKHELAS